MKKLIPLFLLFLILFSCQKAETQNHEIPEWLIPQTEGLEKSGECYGCSVTRITYEDAFYYHLYCGYWSCMYCNLYDSNGSLVDWELEEFNNFLQHKTDEIIIWRCGD